METSIDLTRKIKDGLNQYARSLAKKLGSPDKSQDEKSQNVGPIPASPMPQPDSTTKHPKKKVKVIGTRSKGISPINLEEYLDERKLRRDSLHKKALARAKTSNPFRPLHQRTLPEIPENGAHDPSSTALDMAATGKLPSESLIDKSLSHVNEQIKRVEEVMGSLKSSVKPTELTNPLELDDSFDYYGPTSTLGFGRGYDDWDRQKVFRPHGEPQPQELEGHALDVSTTSDEQAPSPVPVDLPRMPPYFPPRDKTPPPIIPRTSVSPILPTRQEEKSALPQENKDDQTSIPSEILDLNDEIPLEETASNQFTDQDQVSEDGDHDDLFTLDQIGEVEEGNNVLYNSALARIQDRKAGRCAEGYGFSPAQGFSYTNDKVDKLYSVMFKSINDFKKKQSAHNTRLLSELDSQKEVIGSLSQKIDKSHSKTREMDFTLEGLNDSVATLSMKVTKIDDLESTQGLLAQKLTQVDQNVISLAKHVVDNTKTAQENKDYLIAGFEDLKESMVQMLSGTQSGGVDLPSNLSLAPPTPKPRVKIPQTEHVVQLAGIHPGNSCHSSGDTSRVQTNTPLSPPSNTPMDTSVSNKSKSNVVIKLKPWSGKTCFTEFRSRFESYSEYNEMTEKDRKIYLETMALSEDVTAILHRYPESKRDTSNKILNLLEERWGERTNKEKYIGELNKRQSESEDFEEFAERVERTAAYAYPELDSTNSKIITDIFISGLRSEAIRGYLKDHNPQSLKQAKDMARYRQNLIESDKNSLKSKAADYPYSENSLSSELNAVKESMNAFSKQFNQWKGNEYNRYQKYQNKGQNQNQQQPWPNNPPYGSQGYQQPPAGFYAGNPSQNQFQQPNTNQNFNNQGYIYYPPGQSPNPNYKGTRYNPNYRGRGRGRGGNNSGRGGGKPNQGYNPSPKEYKNPTQVSDQGTNYPIQELSPDQRAFLDYLFHSGGSPAATPQPASDVGKFSQNSLEPDLK